MTDEERLAELLLAWEESFEQGRDLPAGHLCQDRPDLEAALGARILSLKKVAWLGNSPRGEGDVQPPALSGSETLAGRYRLEAMIAEGGSGQVWRAFDLDLQRAVAVKVPRRRL